MKKLLPIFTLLFTIQFSTIHAQYDKEIIIPDDGLNGGGTSTSVVLAPPANFGAQNLELAGQSTSPQDVKFTWNDNSTGEDGYKFYRKYFFTWWHIGNASANTTSETIKLWFWPKREEIFRVCSYKGENKSSYAYVTIDMLRPDLVISEMITNTTCVGAGQTITINSTVKNQGTYEAGSSTTTYYLSRSSKGDDINLGNNSVSSLDINASVSSSKTLTIPTSASGNYYIVAKADGLSKIVEKSNSNNYFSIPISVSSTDMSVSGGSVSNNNPDPGSSISVNCTVKNTGTETIGATVLKLFLSKSKGGTTTALGSVNVNSLTANQTQSISKGVTIPSSTTDDEYYIVLKADATNLISESNESNNTISIPLTIGTVSADLELTKFELDGSTNDVGGCPAFHRGDWVTGDIYIKNKGNKKSSATDVTFFFSTNAKYDDYNDLYNDIQLNNTTSIGEISASSSDIRYSITSFDLPDDISSRYYYIHAFIDWNGRITESSRDNNYFALKIYVYGGSKIDIKPIPDDLLMKQKKSNTDLILQPESIIYPNPSNGNFKVNLPDQDFDKIEVYDLSGKLIFTKKTEGINYTSIDLEEANPGTYIVVITGKEKKETRKLMIE